MDHQPDILLVLSDQHAAWYTGYESGTADTPNLDAMAAEGTRFSAHYTSCPLCVPARMSFLSGKLPTECGVTGNNHTIGECTPTFLFPLVEAGYETVLIGRMHFLGKDLRHGFTKRICGDMTQNCWTIPRETLMEERGKLFPTFGAGGSLNVVGAGENPVVNYDRYVVEHALAYLAQPHEKPQFLIVGTFGPHSPYVADPDLYRKYKERGVLPRCRGDRPDYAIGNPWLAARMKNIDEDTAANAAAAYCALIEQTDRYVGQLRTTFEAFTSRNGRQGIFCYTSDHGDTVGARGMYGKQTFFEDSARVPLLFTGAGIPRGQCIETPTGIMDLGATFCAMAGAEYPGAFTDGTSLMPLLRGERPAALENRPVISQFIDTLNAGNGGWEKNGVDTAPPAPPKLSLGVMVRKGPWKYVRYHGSEDTACLIRITEDPEERNNLIGDFPEIAAELAAEADKCADPAAAEQAHRRRNRMNRWLRAYEAAAGFEDAERWKDNPPTARGDLAFS